MYVLDSNNFLVVVVELHCLDYNTTTTTSILDNYTQSINNLPDNDQFNSTINSNLIKYMYYNKEPISPNEPPPPALPPANISTLAVDVNNNTQISGGKTDEYLPVLDNTDKNINNNNSINSSDGISCSRCCSSCKIPNNDSCFYSCKKSINRFGFLIVLILNFTYIFMCFNMNKIALHFLKCLYLIVLRLKFFFILFLFVMIYKLIIINNHNSNKNNKKEAKCESSENCNKPKKGYLNKSYNFNLALLIGVFIIGIILRESIS